MHFFQLGEADCLSCQPFDSRPQGQVLSLNLLGVLLSNHLLPGRQMAFVGSPVIGIKPGYAKWLQQLLQLQKHNIFPVAEDISEDVSCRVVNRMPKPALISLVSYIAPHLVKLCAFNPLNLNNNAIRFQAL